jgi:plastocyanin
MQRFVKTFVLVTLGLAIAAFAVSSPTLVRGAPIGDRPAAALSITLYASFAAPTGWGWAATNITEPGPTLTVHQGDVITFHLFAHDATGHILVIDLNNNMVNDAGDQASAMFSSATAATNFTFTASTAGTFDYFCGVHGYAAQHGSLVVQATGGGGGGGATSGGIDPTLLIGGVVIIVAIVAVVAAIVMRRKKP